jgi:hypothetical protein
MVMRGQGFLYDRVEVEPDVDQTDHEHKNHRTPLSTRCGRATMIIAMLSTAVTTSDVTYGSAGSRSESPIRGCIR